MTAATLVSVEEYLTTSYDPDCDYVDGQIEERNVGENDHAEVQSALLTYVRVRHRQWGVYAVVEQRVRVAPGRYRVPDVSIVAGARPKEQIFRTPPLACIEVLSPEDRLSRVRERMSDYLDFGVRYVFLLDPQSRKAFRGPPRACTKSRNSAPSRRKSSSPWPNSSSTNRPAPNRNPLSR